MTEIQKRLFALQDLEYRDFHSRLMPNISPETIIGVRVPQVRALAKELYDKGAHREFFNALPHKYYEENNLHAFLIERICDFDECIECLERFLPYVDNWATCDSLRPKALKKDLDALLERIYKWLSCDKPYTVRFGIEMLMCHFLCENFKPEYAELVARVDSNEYYVNMMISWYFATALSKHYEQILPYIENSRLPFKAHNKAIQKALESRRISPEQKAYLKELKKM